MKTITVRFYRTESGGEPVREWLKALSKKDKIIIGEDIRTVELGWPLGMPLVKKLDKNLSKRAERPLPSGRGCKAHSP